MRKILSKKERLMVTVGICSILIAAIIIDLILLGGMVLFALGQKYDIPWLIFAGLCISVFWSIYAGTCGFSKRT
jgi:hypothetical protein